MGTKNKMFKDSIAYTAKLTEKECIWLHERNPKAHVALWRYPNFEIVEIGKLTYDKFDFDGYKYITVLPHVKNAIENSFRQQKKLALTFP